MRSGNQAVRLRNPAVAGESVGEDGIERGDLDKRFQQSTFGGHFVEVAPNAAAGKIPVRRVLAVYVAGRVLISKSARSTAIGGMTMEIGATLMEELTVDTRCSFFVNHDFAGYDVPVHVDNPYQELIFLDEIDLISSPIKESARSEYPLLQRISQRSLQTGGRTACGTIRSRLPGISTGLPTVT